MSVQVLLALFLPLQEPVPPTTTDAPPPSERARRIREAVAESRAAQPPPPVEAKPAKEAPTTSRFEKLVAEGPLHYAFYYSPDYAATAVLGATWLGMYLRPPPTSTRAAFGPSYDPGTRDASEVMDRRNDRLLGAPYRPDTVPSWAPALVGNGALVGAGVLTAVTTRSFRKVHHVALGALQAQLGSLIVAEVMDSAFGRLRPDYRDRMARYYCSGQHGEVPAGVQCGTAWAEAGRQKGYWLSDSEFAEGSRSFPSRHTVSAFAVATYFTLFMGGEHVWGENATAASRLPAIAAMTAAMTGAAFVGASRITDNRHHLEDVVVGAGLGAGSAAAGYFLHFDLQGRPYVRSLSFTPFATPGGMGFGLKGVVP